ncbi:MAG: M81 family metallopeptidase [Burkholderiales bacterium]|nr:M81 family metallopeptidase [Burkholderiales bacterium]
MARIAIGGFQHETNSFAAHRADYGHFAQHRDRPPLVRGAELLASLRGNAFATSGFLDALGPDDVPVPLVWASGGAGGTVTDDAFERIVGEMVGELSRQLPVDAVYLDLHGAMVSTTFEDAEAEILRRVRAVVGAAVPVVVSLDYHANLSPAMVEGCDGMAAYRTYPHVDRPETGQRAAALVRALLARGRPAGRAVRHLPFLLPVDFQSTLCEPSRSVVAWTPPQPAAIVSATYAAGFPPADTAWCGPAVAVHAWTQVDADAAADAYLALVSARETAFHVRLWDTDAGVREAMRLADGASRPVVIADTQDNPGAGGSGDTTGIIAALLRHGARDAIVGFLCDPGAAAGAHAAGVGASVTLDLGGRHGPPGVAPLHGQFRVLACARGPFTMTGAVTGRSVADLGAMALLRCDGVDIVVTSRNVQAYDPAPFDRLGVDWTTRRIVVLKSSCHFRADFEPRAAAVLTVLAPGAYDPDPRRYPYRRLRTGVRLLPRGAP